jgi:hypothetical protein
MNERTISSDLTFLMKFVFPTIWITGFGMGTLGLFFGVFHGQNDQAAPEFMRWQFLSLWIVGTIFLWWSCARLKKVRIGSDAIYVSNFRQQIRIPFGEIQEVTENRWLNSHPITISFRMATPFGNRIVFMPKSRLFVFGSYPIVDELRKLAHL